MNGDHTEVQITIDPPLPGREILIAYLSELPFDSVLETEVGLKAYMPEQDWKQSYLHTLEAIEIPGARLEFSISRIKAQNWNATWEAGFDPIQVDNRCFVRAPFHSKSEAEFDIEIMPKMSFGTGHHATTYLMLQLLMEEEVKGKDVLDMGCGTGVLAILAHKMMAAEVVAIDIDEWSYENTRENTVRNACNSIQVMQGDATLLEIQPKFHLILANINKNVLLQDIPTYALKLKPGGALVVSGFYADDLGEIDTVCHQAGLSRQKLREKDNWVAAKYVF